MMIRACWFALAAAAALPVCGVDRRFRLACAEDWSGRRGFYLNFENKEARDGLCRIDTMHLFLGVGDGRRRRFPSVSGPWKFDHDYHVRIVLTDDHAEIWIDGKKCADDAGGFVPGPGVVMAGEIPAWAKAPAEYMVCQKSLLLRAADGKERRVVFPERWKSPPGVLVFNADSGAPRRIPWDPENPLPWTIDTVFRIIRIPSVDELAPMVDRYGQARYAEWPEKVRTDADLQQDAAREAARLKALPLPSDRDRFGGWTAAGWREKKTGFFRTVRRNGVWWLVTPDGNPCFYVGVDSLPMSTWPQTPVEGRRRLFEWLPPKTPPWLAAWGRNHWGHKDGDYVALQACNLIRKFGADGWNDQAVALAVERIRRFAFMGGGKWGAPPNVVSTPVLWLRGVPKISRHPDVFDPAVIERIRTSLAAQIEPRKNDPYVLGWSIGNERDEIIEISEIRDILQKRPETPAKRALLDFALDTLYKGNVDMLARAWNLSAATRNDLYRATPTPPPDDIERLRRFYADRYYRTLHEIVKELDPNHLYLGFWIVPGWWVNEEDWRLIASHCDVIGYDRYAWDLTDERLERLIRETGRPVLLGEFSFPPYYGGTGLRGFGRYAVYGTSDADSGERYAAVLRQAATHPYCVGALWFEYRDQPVTGRGPGHGPRPVYGEHYAFGIVTITDRVKWDLALRMRTANLSVYRRRAAASGE